MSLQPNKGILLSSQHKYTEITEGLSLKLKIREKKLIHTQSGVVVHRAI
jgi:hypothetical protein